MPGQPIFSRSTAVKVVALVIALVFINACTDSQNANSRLDQAVGESADTGINDVELPMPAGFLGLRAVILSNVYAIVSIDGYNPRTFVPGDTLTTTYDDIAPGDTFNGTIQWFETLPDSIELLLASYTIRETIEQSLTLSIDGFDYDTEGSGFDEDNDGFSNLRERRADSDPLNRNETPDTTPNVRIGSVEPLLAPVIDGLYDRIYGDSAVFNDEDGEQLNIDNLMIDQGALRADGNTEFRWFAVHDDTFLYIFVLGESAAISSPIRDSTFIFQDDSIDIFIDADNSKGSAYDGINDRHIIIPLLTSPTQNTGSNTTAFTAGPNSASLPTVEFATCLCPTDQNTWEVKIPLEAFGIEKDRPFGFEIQLNEDNDGGARDAKWGWFHPSRTTVDVDNTFSIPSFMGTAVVN